MLNTVTFFYNQEGVGLKRPSASFLKNLKLSSTVLRQSLDSILKTLVTLLNAFVFLKSGLISSVLLFTRWFAQQLQVELVALPLVLYLAALVLGRSTTSSVSLGQLRAAIQTFSQK